MDAQPAAPTNAVSRMASRSVTGSPWTGFLGNIPSCSPCRSSMGYHRGMTPWLLTAALALAQSPADQTCCDHPRVAELIASVARVQAATLPTRPESEPGPAALMYRLHGSFKNPPKDLPEADQAAWRDLIAFAAEWRNRPEAAIAGAVPELGRRAEWLALRHEGSTASLVVRPCKDGGRWLQTDAAATLPEGHACALP